MARGVDIPIPPHPQKEPQAPNSHFHSQKAFSCSMLWSSDLTREQDLEGAGDVILRCN